MITTYDIYESFFKLIIRLKLQNICIFVYIINVEKLSYISYFSVGAGHPCGKM